MKSVWSLDSKTYRDKMVRREGGKPTAIKKGSAVATYEELVISPEEKGGRPR